MSARVQVGITTYRDYKYLELLLQSIRWYTYREDGEYDVVVCDDGTPEAETLTKIEETCAKFGATLIRHEQNLGIPAGWNHLTQALGAQSEIVVLLNNDLLMVPNWLRVACYFLDTNKDNPCIGTCYWNPVNRVPYDLMAGCLPLLGTQTFEVLDRRSGRPADFFGDEHNKVQQGRGHGLGRAMCPCGCCFAFRRAVYEEVGPFNEQLTSFHEESDFGTRCAAHGRASWGFPYPRPIHTHGYTFNTCRELQASQRMRESRALYRRLWDVPDNVPDNEYFNYVNQRLMPAIPPVTVKYLVPDYEAEAVTYTLAGGEPTAALPCLVECEGTY